MKTGQQSNPTCLSSQEMSSAVITYCGHFFHGNCLRKWLYVQETCPMCHQNVRPTAGQNQASGDAAAPATDRDTEPDPPAQEGEQNQDADTPEEPQGEAVTPDPSEQRGDTGSFEDGDKDQPAEPHSEAAQGLRFSSSGDFVGFVSPASSCSSGGISNSQVLLGEISSNMHEVQGEESNTDSLLPSTRAVNENAVEGQSDSSGAAHEVTSCPEVPQNGDDDMTPQSWNSLDSPESNNTDSDLDAAGRSLAGHQTSVKSCDKNSELLDCVDDSHDDTYSDLALDGLREAETVPQIPRLPPQTTHPFAQTDTSD